MPIWSKKHDRSDKGELKANKQYAVKRIVDGDTFYVEDGTEKGTSIRLIGVDTPETKDMHRLLLIPQMSNTWSCFRNYKQKREKTIAVFGEKTHNTQQRWRSTMILVKLVKKKPIVFC